MIGLLYPPALFGILYFTAQRTSAAPALTTVIEPRRNTNNVLYAQLWGNEGPSCDDIDQPLCIVAERGKDWLMSAVHIEKVLKIISPDIKYDEDNPPVVDASFHLFKSSENPTVEPDPESGSGTTWIYKQTHGTDDWIKLNFADDIRREDSDTSSDNYLWWISGFQHAFAEMFTEEYLDGGFSAHALNALTNRDTVMVHNPKKDDKWKILQASPHGVVMLGTTQDPDKLEGNHAYAVFDAWTEDGVKMVKLRNPWGPTNDYKFDDIVDDVDTLYHFKNWDVLKPDSGLKTPTPQTQTLSVGPLYTPLPGPGGDII